ncbi:MAG: hypothetical protein ATN34_00840 [Epulopiscium sp. Nele67-Bin002]|nr:MAG: hypothetical protein ATN34_00840 [Epulopiscium sp. Nele67-Bin002]
MLLKKLTLENFRQFNGKQSIEFSTDKTNNVTVVLAENGTGKTTLAQSFRWVLYEKTDFKAKKLINASLAERLEVGKSVTVAVTLELTHSNIDYTIKREQKYTKATKELKVEPSRLTMSKNTGVKQVMLTPAQAKLEIKRILPDNLSRYFFSDGERIERMGRELESDKSNKDFLDAVRGLLGLNTLAEAIDHLGTNRGTGVIGKLERRIDDRSNAKIKTLGETIKEKEAIKIDTETKMRELEEQRERFIQLEKELSNQLQQFESIADYEVEAKKFIDEIDKIKIRQQELTQKILKTFATNALNYLAKPLHTNATEMLKQEQMADTGIPELHSKTVKYLIDRRRCLCNQVLEEGSKELAQLLELLHYVPPKSIGSQIKDFISSTEIYSQTRVNLFNEVDDLFKDIMMNDERIEDLELRLNECNKYIINNGEVATIKIQEQDTIENRKSVENQLRTLTQIQQEAEIIIRELEAQRENLLTLDKENLQYRLYREYAKAVREKIVDSYGKREIEIRQELEITINEIFTTIYDGQMSIELDNKYRVSVVVADVKDSVEKSTAQSISVILAFIAGVLKMAKKRADGHSAENNIVSEPYPLVMDAPLSAFDKRRIKNVCTVLPQIAEQVIIFIKDTDGELAEQHMNDIIGKRLFLQKSNETNTLIKGR